MKPKRSEVNPQPPAPSPSAPRPGQSYLISCSYPSKKLCEIDQKLTKDQVLGQFRSCVARTNTAQHLDLVDHTLLVGVLGLSLLPEVLVDGKELLLLAGCVDRQEVEGREDAVWKGSRGMIKRHHGIWEIRKRRKFG
jgi:hypothetical protein